ncbi:MAG: hypothetical protein WD988_01090 [Candidatus Curtissbacteria bacterium]
MYAQVVVLTYQSPQIDSYTYEIPEGLNIKVGQLVSVPFGTRNPQGIVVGFQNQIDLQIKTKPIISTILEEPILLPYQIELLKWMASYYMAPMINCLDAMLPQMPSQSTIVNRLSTQTIVHTRSTIDQTLVLVPNIDRIPETLASFPQAKNYAIYHSELAMVPKFEMWQKIMSGNCDFIFGSRLAIFTPLPKLKKIIIYDEHDGAYKDERSPYFDTLTVAEKIAQLTRAKIEIIDCSPRVTTFANHPDVKIPKLSVPTKTIDMTIEKAYGNFSPISETLEEILKRAADKKLRVLLFLNKKSESGSVYCKSCKTQSAVPKQVDVCPSCGSADIYFNSVNVSSLSARIKKILPDASTDIETAAAFYKLSPQKYDVSVHVKTDSVLAIPDYTSTEKLYTQIINLKKLTKKLVVLQTYNPNHFAVKNAVSSNYQQFYLEETRQRKIFSYPPYTLLIKIVVSGTEENIQEIFESLDSRLSPIGPFKGGGPAKYNIILKIPLPNYSLQERSKALEKIKSLLPRQKNIRIIVDPDSLI